MVHILIFILVVILAFALGLGTAEFLERRGVNSVVATIVGAAVAFLVTAVLL